MALGWMVAYRETLARWFTTRGGLSIHGGS
jgi:hypothetical protein